MFVIVLGFIGTHSSLVPNVHHLSTGFVFFLHHFVFDSFESALALSVMPSFKISIINFLSNIKTVYINPLVHHLPPQVEAWLSQP